MVSTVVLGVFAIILLIASFSGTKLTGEVISEEAAGQIILDFAKEQTGEDLEIVEINEQSGLYEVIVKFQGSDLPLYLTKDGENLINGLTPLAELNAAPVAQQEAPPQEVVKSDKPKVELFIMTHCPYGTQAEKGFVPFMKAIGDKVDAKIRFVHYFMHTNQQEEVETPRQVCIREEQPDKFEAYLECFLGGKSGTTDEAITCELEVGIDSEALQTCIDTNADGYYAEDSALSEEYGVRGSPTLVVNGQIVQSGRNPDAYLQTVCGAFNIAPEECETALSTENPSPGFGYGSSGVASSASCS